MENPKPTVRALLITPSYATGDCETMYIEYLHNRNNQRSNDMSLHDWSHNDKTDPKLYLLGTNHNLKEKQNIEAGLIVMQY